MALDRNPYGGAFLQSADVCGQSGAGVLTDIVLVVVEECVLDVGVEKLRITDRWWRRRRRFGDCDARFGRYRTTRSRCLGQVGRRRGGTDRSSSGRLYCSHSVVYDHSGRIGGIPG